MVYLQEQYESEEIDEEIFYTIPQLQQMNSPRRIKRKISNEEDVLWSGGIVYYEFDGTHSKLPVFITKGKSSSCNCNRPVHHQPNSPFGKPMEQCIYFHACSSQSIAYFQSEVIPCSKFR